MSSRIVQCYFIISVFCMLSSCRPAASTPAPSDTFWQLKGEAIGTYYAIQYEGKADYETEIRALIDTMNQSLSTYVPSSTISRFNQSRSTRFGIAKSEDRHFLPVWRRAKQITALTGKAFDPTVMPLVNYYGFGYAKKSDKKPDPSLLPKLLPLVDFDKMSLEETVDSFFISKEAVAAELDFSASAKGYYIDQVAAFLKNRGVKNLLVDIGGEAYAQGQNPRGKTWTIGINKPIEGKGYTGLELALKLDGVAIATSGNYFNYRVDEAGQKYVHTIHPETGLTHQSDILSVTVRAYDCMQADALATACMVMGLDRAKAFIEGLADTEACFLTGGTAGSEFDRHYTSGFERMVVQ